MQGMSESTNRQQTEPAGRREQKEQSETNPNPAKFIYKTNQALGIKLHSLKLQCD